MNNSNQLDSVIILNTIQKNKDKLKMYGVHTIGIFGSYARNEQNHQSDVDILIDFTEGQKNIRNLVYLAEFLEELLSIKVDLVLEKNLRPEIRPFVMEDIKYAKIQ